MPIHVLDVGTLRPPGAGDFPTQCLLVERRNSLLAVDAGLSTALLADQSGLSFERYVIRPPRRTDLALVHQVRALGYDPRDVQDIVLTHLHSEHAAGIMDFPHARIHVSHTEHTVAHNGSLRSRISYRHSAFAHSPRWVLHDGRTSWHETAGVAVIDDDTLLVPLPGHTAGHCGVAVRTDGGGWILHAGDAAYADPAGDDAPVYPLRQYQWLSAVDRKQLRHSQNELRRLAGWADVQIICSHRAIGQLPLTWNTATNRRQERA